MIVRDRTYRIIYTLALFLPAKSLRRQKCRAESLAAAIHGFVQDYSALGFAIMVNAGAVVFLSFLTFTVVSSKNGDALSVTLGSFVQEKSPHAPSAKGGDSALSTALAQASQQMMTTPPITKSAPSIVTTTAPTPLLFEIAPVSLSSAPYSIPTRSLPDQQGLNQPRDNTKAEGRDGGKAIGTNKGAWSSERRAKGNFGEGWTRPGKDGIRNQDIIIIMDISQAFIGAKSVTPEIQRLWDALRKNNTVIGEMTVQSGMIASRFIGGTDKWPTLQVQDRPFGRVTTAEGQTIEVTPYSDVRNFTGSDVGKCDYNNAYYAILDACEKFKGRKALLVVSSDFVERENCPEDIEFLAKRLIAAELRLYLITSEQLPESSAYTIARQSGGDVRRVYVPSYSERSKDSSIQWSDPESRNLLRNLDDPEQ